MIGNRTIKVTGTLLLTMAVVALVGPWVSPHDYMTIDLNRILESPSLGDFHLFGTDGLGRDLFVRTMHGIRVTMLVAVVASLVSLVIGVAYGAIAGFVGGRVDAAMMRFVDTLYALPFIFFVIPHNSMHRQV